MYTTWTKAMFICIQTLSLQASAKVRDQRNTVLVGLNR